MGTEGDGRREVAAHFSSVADAYDRYWSDALMPANRTMVERLPMKASRVVADIGAGVGSLHRTLVAAAPDARILLCDRAEGMIRRADRQADRIVADVDRLPLRDRTVDVALMAFMLQYVDDPVHTFAEVRRVLRAGGYLGVLAWGSTTPSRAVQRWMAGMDEAGAPPDPMTLQTYYAKADTIEKLTGISLSAGYTDVEVQQLAWADQPDVGTFFERQVALGVSGRRFAAWDEAARNAYLSRMRDEFATLDRSEFRDDSEVLMVIARA
jgi:ubiquinone/menaquinone biosynthesis C-methylase UbiE